MFSGRLPDHLLHSGTVLDEAAAFEAIVQKQRAVEVHPLQTPGRRKLLDQDAERDLYGGLGVPRTPSVRVVDHVW